MRDNKQYFHYDHIGNLVQTVKASGEVIGDLFYTPYGEPLGGTINQIDRNQPFGFSTKRSDFASGLVYFGYRFYVPYMERWLNRDPIGIDGGLNIYGYVENNPLIYTDPWGLRTLRCARKLGDRNNPAMSPSGNPFRHDYLVVDGEVFSFQAGDNMFWSDGQVDQNENKSNDQCEVVSEDSKFDNAVKQAISGIGAPKYNVYAYPFTTPHMLGARNCQTWADDVLDRANEIYSGGR